MNARSLLITLTCSLSLIACGKKDESAASAPASATAPATAAPTAAPAPAAVVANDDAGKKVYGTVCATCHAAAVAGAPKPGDKADWQPRIAQGTEVLYKHAIEGYTGAKGMMPAKGGQTSLGDADVKSAVDYMVALSR